MTLICYYYHRLSVCTVRIWASVCKTVRPVLSDSCLSVLSCQSVCDIAGPWPNDWTDQDETWHGGRLPTRPHCVRWEASSHKGAQQLLQFSVYVCCGQTAGWIKILLCMEVGLRPGHIVLDGNPAPLQGTQPQFSASVCCGQTAGWIKMPLGTEVYMMCYMETQPPLFDLCLLSQSPTSATTDRLYFMCVFRLGFFIISK